MVVLIYLHHIPWCQFHNVHINSLLQSNNLLNPTLMYMILSPFLVMKTNIMVFCDYNQTTCITYYSESLPTELNSKFNAYINSECLDVINNYYVDVILNSATQRTRLALFPSHSLLGIAVPPGGCDLCSSFTTVLTSSSQTETLFSSQKLCKTKHV